MFLDFILVSKKTLLLTFAAITFGLLVSGVLIIAGVF